MKPRVVKQEPFEFSIGDTHFIAKEGWAVIFPGHHDASGELFPTQPEAFAYAEQFAKTA